MKALMIGFAATSLLMAALPQSAMAQAPAPAAAQVHADAGAVRVGKTSLRADTSMGANPGDMVMVADGKATVTYANGCAVTVTGRYRIPAVAPTCAPVPVAVASAGGTNMAAIGLGAAALVGLAAAAGGGGGGGSDNASSP
jgi:hypothetical protein